MVVSLLFVSLFLVDVNILLPLAVDYELAVGLIVGFILWIVVLGHLLLSTCWQSMISSYFVFSIAMAALYSVLR